ncbi:PDDEXK nuclease domain-containing protein [Catenibacillus scindens]|uniref:PDDEXK nuclease domain-containing protein n=1 Tax=Catenibacillus scindens TaxID=673271 RepID=UPI003209490E
MQASRGDYKIDLLFFRCGLQCMAAFELKIGRFKPEYISKMDFCLEALGRQKKRNMGIQVRDDILCNNS